MDPDIHEQFRILRQDNQTLRGEVRADIHRLHEKLDEHLAAIADRCARRGEELAVLRNRERERDRRVDRRIALGLLVVAALSVALKLIL